MLLLYTLWDDWIIFMISGLNEQLQQPLEYTLQKPYCRSCWISKIKSRREDALEERYPINFVLNLEKMPKLRGCRYERTEEMKETVTKVIDTLTQEDFHGAFQKLLERHNKCIEAGGNYFEWGLEFFVFTINKRAHKKNVWKLI